LRCGPGRMVFVGYGGKLVERVNGNEPSYSDERRRQKKPAFHLPATKKLKLAAPAMEIIRTGITAAQGGFFCYFSCPSRKVKEKNRSAICEFE
jgi:hypothetical protein